MAEDRLDQLLKEMREETASAEELAAMRGRVRERIVNSLPELCGHYQGEFPAYMAGELPQGRRLLFDDHLSRCVACREALAAARNPVKVSPIRRPEAPAARGGGWQWKRWAAAAAVLVAVLWLGRDRIDSAFAPAGPRATVAAVSGSVLGLSGAAIVPGMELGENDFIRTASGARAVLRLADGSTVEMNERTELAVRAAWSGQTVWLERGDVVVEAAKQRQGRLRVVTHDSQAAVKGTVFAVSTGTAGSVVAVVEGAVQVSQPSGERLLTPGQQAASTRVLAKTNVRQAVAWSADAEKYYELLGELISLEQELASAVQPLPRTSSQLVSRIPAGTVAYWSIPNLGTMASQAISLIEQRAARSAAVREWWSAEHTAGLRELLSRVQQASPSLGEEIAFLMVQSPGEEEPQPFVLAEVKPGQEANLEQSLTTIAGDSRTVFRVVGNLLVAADSAARLEAIVPRLGTGAGTAFAVDIAAHYRNGVGVLGAVDSSALQSDIPPEPRALFSRPQRLFFEQRFWQGLEENIATVSFRGERQGLASILASPAPAGSAEYASQDAAVAISGVTRRPRQVLEEVLRLTADAEGSLAGRLERLKQETGIDFGNDIADGLGTDFTFVIEKATIPLPGWVAILEVTQPSLLDSTARRLVETVNQRLAAEGKPAGAVLEQQEDGGRTWHTIRGVDTGRAVHWTYDRGYLVASTDRGQALQAIQTRAQGFPLIRSSEFRDRLPSIAGVHQSGFFWLNTRGALAGLATNASDALRQLLENRDPLLVILNGESEQITAASRTRLTSLVLDVLLASGPRDRPSQAASQ